MSAIDTAMLSAMRDAIESLLPDTCNTLSPTHSADGQGGVTTTWGTVGTALACRLDVIQSRGVLAGGEQNTGGAIQAYASYMLSVPYDTALEESYRVEHNGNLYAVKTVNNNQSWKAVVRAELSLL